jgi:hypothetical protein
MESWCNPIRCIPLFNVQQCELVGIGLLLVISGWVCCCYKLMWDPCCFTTCPAYGCEH